MGPQRVPAVDAPGCVRPVPDGGGLAQPARPQLQSHQRGERPLGRAAGGPATPDRLGQGVGVRSAGPRPRRATTVATHPSTRASAVSSRASAAFCAGGVLRAEQPLAGQRVAQRLGIGDVDVRHGLLQPGHVDGDAAGVLLDRAEQVRRAATGRARTAGGGRLPAGPGRAGSRPRRPTGPARTAPRPRAAARPCPSGPSGSPMSEEPTTSRASSPTAVPVWLPIIAPPICRIIRPAPAARPGRPRRRRGPRAAWRISSGISSPSCAGSMLSMPPIASTPLAAMGSQSLAQTGKVGFEPFRTAPRLDLADSGGERRWPRPATGRPAGPPR